MLSPANCGVPGQQVITTANIVVKGSRQRGNTFSGCFFYKAVVRQLAEHGISKCRTGLVRGKPKYL